MSDEARAYVKTFSPFKNGTWWFHYVMADIANASHSYLIWDSSEHLTKEWPALTADTITRGRKALLDAGELKLVESQTPREPAVYRFTFKQCPEMALEGPKRQNLGSAKSGPRVRKIAPVAQPYCSSLTEVLTEEPKDLAPPLAAGDEVAEPAPLTSRAQALTRLAFEQDPKPVTRGGFPAVKQIILRVLEGNYPDERIAAAIQNGVDVWTIAGLTTALARSNGHGKLAYVNPREEREKQYLANALAARSANGQH